MAELTQELKQLKEAVLGEVRKVIVGQEEPLEGMLVALLAQGHVLLEGVPGTAKTLMVRAMAGATRRVVTIGRVATIDRPIDRPAKSQHKHRRRCRASSNADHTPRATMATKRRASRRSSGASTTVGHRPRSSSPRICRPMPRATIRIR